MKHPEPAETTRALGSYTGERRTRLSAVWTALAIAVVALVALLVFVMQNPGRVEVSFLVFHGTLPLAIALLFAMVLGAVIVLSSGAARIMQLRGVARRARRVQGNTTPPEEPPNAAASRPDPPRPAIQ